MSGRRSMRNGTHCPYCASTDHWISECTAAPGAVAKDQLDVYLGLEAQFRNAPQGNPSSVTETKEEVKATKPQDEPKGLSSGLSAGTATSVVQKIAFFSQLKPGNSLEFSLTLNTASLGSSLYQLGLAVLLLAILVAVLRFSWSRLLEFLCSPADRTAPVGTATTGTSSSQPIESPTPVKDGRSSQRVQEKERPLSLCVHCHFRANKLVVCDTCLMWVCTDCQQMHNRCCRREVSEPWILFCMKTCYECGREACGLTDCISKVGNDGSSPESPNDWTGSYHIGPRCALKLIEQRHPEVWWKAFKKTEIDNANQHVHSQVAKSTARFFCWLSNIFFQEELNGYRQGNHANEWNNFQLQYNNSPHHIAEEARTLSLLYHATKTPPPGLELRPDGTAGYDFGQQGKMWPVADIQTHSRALWVSLITRVNPRAITKGQFLWIDATLGRFQAPLDLKECYLSDGGPALLLFQAICKKLGYEPTCYPALEAEDSTNQDPVGHLSKGGKIEHSSQCKVQDPNKKFLAFMPWQLVALGIVGILLGHRLEYVASGNDLLQ